MKSKDEDHCILAYYTAGRIFKADEILAWFGNLQFDFTLPGIVLIDEIETHLHLELQKNIMPLLTSIFPNIQFVATSHSPYILNSLENVVIYDLENHLLAGDGMNNLSYESIAEGYFRADRLSDTLKAEFGRYKNLVQKEGMPDDEIGEIVKLEYKNRS